MERGDIPVIFDPYALRGSLTDPATPYWEALEALISVCPNKLVIDDVSGRLSSEYESALGGQWRPLLDLLLDRVPRHKRRRRKTHPLPRRLGDLPSQHETFLSRALRVRPRYLVYRVQQWDREGLAERILAPSGVELVSPEEYVRRTRPPQAG